MIMESDAALGLTRGTVRVVPYDARWPALFLEETRRVSTAIAQAGLASLEFQHVGSTSIPGLDAKPILDMDGGYVGIDDLQPYIDTLINAGYELRGPQGVPDWQLLVLGSESRRTHHLNLVPKDGVTWRKHQVFREKLMADPELFQAYASLKRQLAEATPDERSIYTASKAEFVANVLKGAV